jgi:hypothetical protein
MTKLPAFTCALCKKVLQALREYDGRPSTAQKYADCHRRCNDCGVGFSNGKNPTMIYENFLNNVPGQVRDGLGETIRQALNCRNNKNKQNKFGFFTSEDAITWTLFTYLQQAKLLGDVARSVGLIVNGEEPSLLLWGAPVPLTNATGTKIRADLIRVLVAIGEEKHRYSEPDVILDFGNYGFGVNRGKT